MSINPLNDISKVYLEQVINEAKKPKPDYLDFDNDGNEDEPMKKALKDKLKKQIAAEGLVGNQHRIDVNKNNKIDSGDFKILRGRNKKKLKEGRSNWRSDLYEIIDKIEKDGKVTDKKVENKIEIHPKLNLGETIEEMGGTLLEMTSIEDLEGVLDDFSDTEIFFLNDDLIEHVVEQVFVECIQEGYNVIDIENTLLESLEISTSILTEAKVTYGHDTEVKKDRLEKVKSAVKKVGKGIAGGVGYAAGLAVRGAKAIGREMKSGYERGRGGSSSVSRSGSTQTSGDSGESGGEGSADKKPGLLSRIGSKLKRGLKKVIAKGARAVSRGARNVARRMEDGKEKTKPTKTQPKPKSQKSPDPWGEPTTPPKSASKPQAKTTTIATKPATKQERKRMYQDVLADVSGVTDAERRAATAKRKKGNESVTEDYYDLETKTVMPGKKDQSKSIETLASKARTKKKTRKPVGTSRRGGSFKPSSREDAEANQASWDDYWSSAAKGYKEEYELLEKAESEQQQKLFGLALSVKRGQTSRDKVSDKVLKIVDSMSEKKIRDFAKTPHKGLPNKIETKEEAIRQEFIARMVEKIEEQSEVYVDEAKLPSSMKKGKKKLESKTQVIHDVDDNLADERHPDAAKIDVMRKSSGKWEKVKSLTPSQFAHHKLRGPGEPVKEEKDDPGDKYGFDQFRSTEKFKKTTKPNKPVVRLGDSPRRPAQKSVVTARGGSEFGSKKPSTPMDKPGEFAKDLNQRIGVKNLKRSNVHFTGGMRTGSGPEKKAEVVKKIVKPDAKKVIATDDHLQNVRHMAAAASETAPKAKVRAYQSKPATKAKGKVKTGDIVPVRVGKEKKLSDPNIGIRSNTNPSKSPKETQRRRKTAKRGMRSEEIDINTEV